jgi:hypothetical protein
MHHVGTEGDANWLLMLCTLAPVYMDGQAGHTVQVMVQSSQAVYGVYAVSPLLADMGLTVPRQHKTCCMDGMIYTLQVQQQVGVICVGQASLKQLQRQPLAGNQVM